MANPAQSSRYNPFVPLRPDPFVYETRSKKWSSAFEQDLPENERQKLNQITEQGLPLLTAFKETYNIDRTPPEWDKLQTFVAPSDPVAALFYTNAQMNTHPDLRAANKEQCDLLATRKEQSCKNIELAGCAPGMSAPDLRQHHNQLIRCANDRALENKANCATKYQTPGAVAATRMVPDDQGHAVQIIQATNAAKNCVDYLDQTSEGRALRVAQEREKGLRRQQYYKDNPSITKPTKQQKRESVQSKASEPTRMVNQPAPRRSDQRKVSKRKERNRSSKHGVYRRSKARRSRSRSPKWLLDLLR